MTAFETEIVESCRYRQDAPEMGHGRADDPWESATGVFRIAVPQERLELGQRSVRELLQAAAGQTTACSASMSVAQGQRL